jgi:hypothetical protein
MNPEMLEMLANAEEAAKSGEAETMAIIYITPKKEVVMDCEGKRQSLALIGALETMKVDIMSNLPKPKEVG